MAPSPRHFNLAAVRAHHNRQIAGTLSEDDTGFILTKPITLTVTRDRETATTTTEPRTTTVFETEDVPASVSDTTTSPIAETTLSSTSSTPPVPVVSVITTPIQSQSPTNTSAPAQSGATSTTSLLGGAVAGIVVVSILAVAGVVFFFVRRRMINNRRSRRATWLKQPAVTPFSFSTTEKSPFSATTPSPGAHIAQAQARMFATVPAMPNASYLNSSGSAPAPNAAIVKSTFIPSLPDELSITTGETVRIIQEYDDGWAMCANGGGEQGMVPLECLDRGAVSAGKRDSSLHGVSAIRR